MYCKTWEAKSAQVQSKVYYNSFNCYGLRYIHVYSPLPISVSFPIVKVQRMQIQNVNTLVEYQTLYVYIF